MPKIEKIEQKLPTIPTTKRVAAYARVSRETERLQHSLSAQISYYSELIQNHPGWEYAGVYADSGLSGTLTNNRSEFQRMLSDCEAGRIDIILTKSISRFARNTVDLLNTVRHLKHLGISVQFEKEHIDSMTEDGELMLTLLASFAQEESHSISENSKWGIRKRCQSGEIGMANKHILGYQYDDKQQKYVVIPEEADIVQQMFQMFIDGYSMKRIAEALNHAGYHTTLGNPFQEASVRTLIHNEIYTGNIRRQKSYTLDPITKKKVTNSGELPQYYMTDCHEAIIDAETYTAVQAEIERREALVNPVYCYTKRITCGICGAPYTRKVDKIKGHTYVKWICRSKKEGGQSCSGKNIPESRLNQIYAAMLELDAFDETEFMKRVNRIIVLADGNLEFHFAGGQIAVWEDQRIHTTKHIPTITTAFDGKIHCTICGNVYHRVNSANRWVYWYCIGKKRSGTDCSGINYTDHQLRQISARILGTDEFDEQIFTDQIEYIAVLENGDLEFHFSNGRVTKWQRM